MLNTDGHLICDSSHCISAKARASVAAAACEGGQEDGQEREANFNGAGLVISQGVNKDEGQALFKPPWTRSSTTHVPSCMRPRVYALPFKLKFRL